jgi:site-specific recombinase XerD
MSGRPCERLFGSHPAQICFEWNTAEHTSDYEGRPQRRSLTKPELQDFFDHLDDQVASLRARGNKGWLATLRDSAAFKICYAYGLRRRELAMLDLEDFAPNPHAPEFGSHGVVYIRWGKANKGGPPRRRSTLTGVSVVSGRPGGVAERLPRPVRHRRTQLGAVAKRARRTDRCPQLGTRFAAYREAVGLPPEIGLHCLRHSYATHLIEDGYDPLFVQQQVGHSHASTTALYTSVSSDFRTRTLRRALDSSISRALASNEDGI